MPAGVRVSENFGHYGAKEAVKRENCLERQFDDAKCRHGGGHHHYSRLAYFGSGILLYGQPNAKQISEPTVPKGREKGQANSRDGGNSGKGDKFGPARSNSPHQFFRN